MNNPESMIESKQVQVSATEPLGFGAGKIKSSIEKDNTELVGEIVRELPNFLVTVAPGLPTTCIDGRPVDALLNGEVSQPRHGVAGGAGITGYAAAELVGWFGESNDEPAERYLRIMSQLESGENHSQVIVGGHVDQGNKSQEFQSGTGCGAADKLPQIFEIMSEQPEFCKSVSSAVLGDAYDDAIMTSLINTSRMLTENNKFNNWTGRIIVDALGDDAGARIEVLQSDDTETHNHKEEGLVINYVDGETFDRDAYFEGTGRQMFDIDVPVVAKIAAKLASGPEAEAQANELLHAAVLYHAATYATLCDGSQRAYIIKE